MHGTIAKIRKTAPLSQIRADDNRGVLSLRAELLFEQSCGQLLVAGGKPSTWFPPGVTWRAEPIFLSSTDGVITLLVNESFYR